MKRSAEGNYNEISQNSSKKSALDFENRVKNALTGSEALDTKHLGGENFVSVNHFLGQTRVHIRRHVLDKEGKLHPTKDGVSLSPMVWRSLCAELKTISSHKSPNKVFVIKNDLCISKKTKDDIQVYVFQRLFQRKNLSMQLIPEFVVLKRAEIGKLCDIMSAITERVQDGLIAYSLSYYIAMELNNLELHPVDTPDPFLVLLDSLCKCLTVSLSIKITELFDCFGCRESYEANFMHACVNKSRCEKWSEYFDQALYSLNMRDIAKDIVRKNLTLDFNYVLGQEEFFDAIDVKKIFESIEKTYVGEENAVYNDLAISCD